MSFRSLLPFVKALLFALTASSASASNQYFQGKSISFEISSNWEVRERVLEEMDVEAYMVDWLEENPTKPIGLIFEKKEDLESKSFEEWAQEEADKFIVTQTDRRNWRKKRPLLAPVELNHLSGYQVFMGRPKRNGDHWRQAQFYLKVGDRRLLVTFSGPSDLELRLYEFLNTIEPTATGM